MERLQAGDSFNIIQFNSTTDCLFRVPRAAARHAREMAQDYIRSLEANGGTVFRVSRVGVVAAEAARLVIKGVEPHLTLVTCYPFQAVAPGGALRYGVTAKAT